MKKIIIALVVGSLFLTSCGGEMSEKDRFVAASVDLACQIVENPEMQNDLEGALALSMDVFAEYGFDVNDEVAMQSLSDSYQFDEEVIEAVQQGVMDCFGSSF